MSQVTFFLFVRPVTAFITGHFVMCPFCGYFLSLPTKQATVRLVASVTLPVYWVKQRATKARVTHRERERKRETRVTSHILFYRNRKWPVKVTEWWRALFSPHTLLFAPLTRLSFCVSRCVRPRPVSLHLASSIKTTKPLSQWQTLITVGERRRRRREREESSWVESRKGRRRREGDALEGEIKWSIDDADAHVTVTMVTLRSPFMSRICAIKVCLTS